MVTVPFVGCTSCQEEGHVNASVAYCEECTEYLCEEHRRAHSKTRLTKGHNVYNVLLSLIDFDSTLDCAIFHLNCAIFH